MTNLHATESACSLPGCSGEAIKGLSMRPSRTAMLRFIRDRIAGSIPALSTVASCQTDCATCYGHCTNQ